MTAYSPDPRDLGAAAPGGGRRRRSAGARPGAGDAPDDADTPGAIARAARYSRWDGRQTVADLDADEVLDALADDVMADGDLAEALRRLMERGWRSGDPTRGDLAGLRDLMDRLEREREAALARHGLGDVLGEIRTALDEIVATERAGVERRLDAAAAPSASSADDAAPVDPALQDLLRDVAARRLDQLDALPTDVGERIRGLTSYDFLEPEARARFDELVATLQRQVMDQFVGGMADSIRSMTPEDLAANREMVRDLNDLMRQRLGGSEPDVGVLVA